jgi:hypothetical protein
LEIQSLRKMSKIVANIIFLLIKDQESYLLEIKQSPINTLTQLLLSEDHFKVRKKELMRVIDK